MIFLLILIFGGKKVKLFIKILGVPGMVAYFYNIRNGLVCLWFIKIYKIAWCFKLKTDQKVL